jgi:hypothetical protein
MDTEVCQAIMKTYYNGNSKCHYRAKYNGYCGIHCCKNTDKTDINLCHGITKSGKNCRKIVKYGNFCSSHKHTEKHDNFHISLYEPDIEWPYMKKIFQFIRKYNNGKDLDKCMKNIDQQFSENNTIYYYGDINDQMIRENRNITVIIKIELIFHNFFIDYNTDHWQHIIKELHEYIGQYNFLKKYREYFRKKFDQQYRLENQKMYIEKVLIGTFGKDISKKIVQSI